AHRVLFLPELLLEIFDGIDADPGLNSKDRRASLASCALVCKAWEGPANDCLWRALPSALALLGLLGPMECTEEGWDYVTDISNADVSRFRRLSNCVLTLTHMNTSVWGNARSKISNKTLNAAISVLSPGSTFGCLLPRLRTLSWYSGASYTGPQVLSFISPSLETFAFNCIGPSDLRRIHNLESGVDTLNALANQTCQLRRILFTWGFGRAAEPLEAAFSKFIRNQTRLQFLSSLIDFTKDIVEALTSSRSTLRVLHCRLAATRDLSFLFVSEILSNRFDSLQELNVVQSDGEINFASISPLLACRSLRQLCLRTARVAALHPSEVVAMATAWPKIEELRLRSSLIGALELHPLPILSVFGKSMGSTLQTLGLDFEVDETTPLPEVKIPDVFNVLSQLRVGEIDRIPGGREENVARYLTALCPSGVSIVVGVSDLFGDPPEDKSLLAGWDKVAYLVQNPQYIGNL
ncbi:hypothetical protein M407DRAFT_221247, partial [Tulasnella calospora MUT 4182]